MVKAPTQNMVEVYMDCPCRQNVFSSTCKSVQVVVMHLMFETEVFFFFSFSRKKNPT